MSDDKVIELGRHEPSVESIVSRLDRHQHHMSSITAIITWNNGVVSTCTCSKSLADRAFEVKVLDMVLDDAIRDDTEDPSTKL